MKVKVVVYESEADNSGKNHSTSTRSPVQTQETGVLYIGISSLAIVSIAIFFYFGFVV